MNLRLPFEQQIAQALAAEFDGARVELSRPISVRDYSQVYRAWVLSNPPRALAVKRCIRPGSAAPDGDTAFEQYAALKRVSDAMRPHHPRFQVPEPVFVNRDLATIAMSWARGQPLTSMIRHPRTLRHGQTWLANVGQWLGRFHAAGPTGEGAFDFGQRAQDVAHLEADPLPLKSFRRGVAILAARQDFMRGQQVHMSWLHGDCKSDNFMIDGDHVCAIDISLRFQNAVEYDLAQFLNHLDLLLLNPRNLSIRTIRSSLRTAFLDGYQVSGLRFDARRLGWIRLWAALTLWRTTLRAQQASLKSWVLQGVFSKLVRSLCRELT